MRKPALFTGNIRTLLKNTAPAVLLLLCAGTVFAQGHHEALQRVMDSITASADSFYAEKGYVQTDKPAYNTGDTLWFKCYLFNAAFLTASAKSSLLYVEIADEHNRVVKRVMVPLYAGLGWGDITLTEKDFPQGEYTLRAYTNWMRNFGERRMFQRRFAVHDLSLPAWLIHAGFRQVPGEDRSVVGAALHVRQVDGDPVSFRDLQIALTDGTKIWYKDRFRTDVDGALHFNFKIPPKALPRQLALIVKDLREGENRPLLTVPVIRNRKDHIDLQFMPEGGNLVAGVRNRVAFKAIGENGYGCDVAGIIYDGRQQAVDSFRSTHLGMGSFYLTPGAGEAYTAAIRLPGGQTRTYALPAVENAGVALRVVNALHSDSVEVDITPSENFQNGYYYLVARSGGIGCFGALLVLGKKKGIFRVGKNIFPSGIARFTLLDAGRRPLCQRTVYIGHRDQLCARIACKKRYAVHDSVLMDIMVSDRAGVPVQGSFSMAVTDDAQVNIDTLKRNSLVSYTRLTSDLKGFVEDPGYYFPPVMTKKIWKDLDNLLLTQGWTGFSWDTVSEAGGAVYPAEHSFSVRGKVTNIFNKPVRRSQVLLFSHRPFSLRETTTGRSGEFVFDSLYPIDTASYMIQAKNRHGKSFNVGVEVDEFRPPVFKPLSRREAPWYVNIDTAGLQVMHTQIANRQEINKLLGKHVLKEVVVVGQKAIKDSKNLNGPGGSDFALDQSDMQKEGKATLGQVLAQKVKGFHLGGKMLNAYVIYTSLVHLVIDGVDLDFFKPEGASYKDYYKQYLDYLTAEDIKGIEVMTSPKYTMKYFQKFLDPMQQPFDHVFIEITTYSGHGAFLNKTPGVYLYKPNLAFSIPDEFYSPQYRVKAGHRLPDIRSTIYWKPDILTGKDGRAQISFYTADKPGSYTLIMEGCDMNGHIMSIRRKIVVR